MLFTTLKSGRKAGLLISLLAALPAAHAQTKTPTQAPAKASTQAPAQAAALKLLPATSEVSFTTRQMGVPVEGRFGSFTAELAVDLARPEAGRVSLSIDTGSARFGSPELDGEVGKPIWMSAAKFPQATFTSRAIKVLAPGKWEVAGRLVIKGLAQDVLVPVQVVQSGAAGTANGTFTLKRLDFKIGEGDWADTSMLANDVQVRFKLAFAAGK